MSIGLADFLITVAEPLKLKEFSDDPDRFLSHFDLTRGDKAAIRSGRGGWIKLQAKAAVDDPDLSLFHPAIAASEHGMDLIEVDLMVEVSNTSNDMIAEDEPGTEFVSDSGERFLAVREL